MGRKTVLAISLVFVLGLCVGCGGQRAIVVGSKNFTEQLILGEIIAQQIEGCAELPVERRFNLGGTLLAHQAITNGEIDVYPEYTGTALTAVLREDPAGRTPEEVFQRVREAYRERFGIEWLNPLGFENTFAMAVPEELAVKHGLRSLSDAAASGLAFRLGVGYEFEQRPDGLPGLLKTYPLKLDGAPRTMDLGLLYRAIQQGQVDMVAGNSTDGQIEAMKLEVLADDKGYFPPYQAAILVRQELPRQSLEKLTKCLADLSGKLDTKEMRELNRNVDMKGIAVAEIARRFLKATMEIRR